MTFSQTVTEHLERACAMRGSATFIEALGEGSLYGEANQRADALAGALGRIGVGKGIVSWPSSTTA